MNLSAYIFFRVIHDFVNVAPVQLVVRHCIIGINLGSIFHVVQHFIL